MANNSVSLLPNRQITDIYYQLKKVTLIIQRTVSSIGLLNQCRYFDVMPTFPKLKGSFATIRDKQKVENTIIKRQLTDDHNTIQSLGIKHLELSSKLLQLVAHVIYRVLLRTISNSLCMGNIEQLKTKNKPKLKEQYIPCQVPTINLSNYKTGSSCLKYKLHHSLMTKLDY